MCKTSTGLKRPISSNFVNLFWDGLSLSQEDSRQPEATPVSPPQPQLSLQTSQPQQPVPIASPVTNPSTDGSASDEQKHAPSTVPACINCRRSKVRCEGGIPCRRCLRLNMDASCTRCEPQKRGRKRKAPADGAVDIKLEPDTSKAPAVKRPRLRAQVNKSATPPAPSSVVPKRSAGEQAEHDAVERFSLLTHQFRSWRDQALAKMEDKTGLTRFLMFCSDVSHMMHEYNQQLHTVADKNKLVSYWLCSNLADDVNRVVAALGPAAVLPKMNSDDSMETAVEKQVYKRMPFGVMMLPLQPRPFAGDSKPWINSHVSELLGYSKEELQGVMNQRVEFYRLLQNSTSMMSTFWDAVSTQRTNFVFRSQWTHKAGPTVSTLTTCWIKYSRGLPAWLCMYLQQDGQVSSAPSTTPALVATPVVSESPIPQIKAAEVTKLPIGRAMARPVQSQLFDDVMVLPSPVPLMNDDSGSSWDESCDKWLGSQSFDDVELMMF